MSSRARGSVLISVALSIAIVAAIAWLLAREGTVQIELGDASLQDETAFYVARSGLDHGNWWLEQVNCESPAPLLNQPLGPHSYDVTFGPVIGAHRVLTSTSRLANGIERTLTQEVDALSPGFAFIELAAEKDVYVHTDDHNDGAKLDMHVKDNGPGAIEHAMLDFDLSGIAPWVVQNADLELTLFEWKDTPPAGDPVVIAAHRTLREWEEGTGGDCPCDGAIWTSYDGNLANTWTTPGGDFDATPVDPQALSALGPAVWNVTAMATDWATGAAPNHGLTLKVLSGPPEQAKFRSREVVEVAERPKLQLELRCPCGVICRRIHRDEFTQRSCDPALDFAGSNGALNVDWSPLVWTEVADDGQPCTGAARLENVGAGDYELRLEGDGVRFERAADLSPLAIARLSFDLRRVALNGTRYLDVEASGDGGSNWTQVRRIYGAGTDAAPQRVELDITPFISASTQIRFVATGITGGAAPHVFIDDVQIDEEPAALAPATTAFPADADSFLDEDKPEDTFPGDDVLELALEPAKSLRPVFYFDVSAVPPASVVLSAKLRLWVDRNNSGAPGALVKVFPLLEAWDEPDVSWNDRILATPWTTPGGEYGAELTSLLVDPSIENDWIEFDVTAVVQEWVDGVSTNHGFLLESDTDQALELSSREENIVARRPVLEVTVP